MLKEIHEQPRSVADTLVGRIDLEHDDVLLDGIELDPKKIKRLVFVACGTSYHASLVGEYLVDWRSRAYWFEVELASEFRYRDPIVGPGDLIVAVSQSGETLDTMEAVREAKRKGASVLAISNVLESGDLRGSRITRSTRTRRAGDRRRGTDEGVHHAARRDGVARDINLGPAHRHVVARTGPAIWLSELVQLPQKMRDVVDQGAQLQVLARRYGQANGFLFLGRGAQHPIALEGALKLKEISYIHAEGYAAGEMKHGPIALIDENLPVVVLVPRGPYYDKAISNLAEVRARQGKVLAIATNGDNEIGSHADDVVLVPDTALELQPILTVVPLQLLSYYVADFKGNGYRSAAQSREVRHCRNEADALHACGRRPRRRRHREARDRTRSDRERGSRGRAGHRASDSQGARSAKAMCSRSQRLAGIQGPRSARLDLVPLCYIRSGLDRYRGRAPGRAECRADHGDGVGVRPQRGRNRRALAAVAGAVALTVYADMCKAIDRGIRDFGHPTRRKSAVASPGYGDAAGPHSSLALREPGSSMLVVDAQVSFSFSRSSP